MRTATLTRPSPDGSRTAVNTHLHIHISGVSLVSVRFSPVEAPVGIWNVLARVIERLSRRCPSLSDRDTAKGVEAVESTLSLASIRKRRMYARLVSQQRNANIQTWPSKALVEERIPRFSGENMKSCRPVGQEVVDGMLREKKSSFVPMLVPWDNKG